MTNHDSSALSDNPPTQALERLLGSHVPLTDGDLVRLRAWFDRPGSLYPPGGSMARELQSAGALLVVRGWVARGVVLEDGRRQIIALHLPGDVLSGTVNDDAELWSLTEGVAADASRFRREVEAPGALDNGLGQAWAAERVAERERLVHQIIRLGRLTAYERTAHLILELHEKQVRIGMAEPGQIALPISQDLMADLLGLSAVHMNRTLQQLRRDGLIAYSPGRVMLPDPRALSTAARLGAVGEARSAARS